MSVYSLISFLIGIELGVIDLGKVLIEVSIVPDKLSIIIEVPSKAMVVGPVDLVVNVLAVSSTNYVVVV